MKTVSAAEFSSDINKYLEIAQNERLVIDQYNGHSFMVLPLDDEQECLLSDEQKNAIDEAIKNIEDGLVYTHQEAMEILRAKHLKHF